MGWCKLCSVSVMGFRYVDLLDTDLLPSVSTEGSREAEYDANTWPELHRLALRVPEAGVHFQGM